MEITQENYPTLYNCLWSISADNNMELSQRYSISPSWKRFVPIFENQLKLLDSEEIETLTSGEESEALDIVKKYRIYWIHDFLNLFFNGEL